MVFDLVMVTNTPVSFIITFAQDKCDSGSNLKGDAAGITELSRREVKNKRRYRDLTEEDMLHESRSLDMMGAVTRNFCYVGRDRNFAGR